MYCAPARPAGLPHCVVVTRSAASSIPCPAAWWTCQLSHPHLVATSTFIAGGGRGTGAQVGSGVRPSLNLLASPCSGERPQCALDFPPRLSAPYLLSRSTPGSHTHHPPPCGRHVLPVGRPILCR